MKRTSYLLALLTVFVVGGCGGSDVGELTGVLGRPRWYHPQPFGTVYIPTGTLHIGQSDQDPFTTQLQRNRQVSIVAFYMDDTEITNNEYRQFVYSVYDSLLRKKLVDNGADNFKFVIPDPDPKGAGEYDILNYKMRLSEKNISKDELDAAREEYYYQGAERYMKRKQWDVRKLEYVYEWEDLYAAAAAPKNPKEIFTRVDKSTFIRKEKVQIYPDTLCWIRDFTYSYNDPQTQLYFWHPKYDDYPVVGVNWRQATAFCFWRTARLNSFYENVLDAPTVTPFRLPTEFEWEYAARGGRDESKYPWGGPYIRNAKGCYLANFKPGRGDYIADGGFYPVKAGAYFPNDYGLYCMAGNVAEWTSTAYAENANNFTDDMNPEYVYDVRDDLFDPNSIPESLKRKVIRGGSWKDIGHYIQTSSRSYEYQDSCKSWVGFRCVMSYIGRSNKDK